MKNPNDKTLFLFRKKKTKPLRGFRGRGAEPHSAKRKNNCFFSKAFFFKVRFIGSIGIWNLIGSIGTYLDLGFSINRRFL